MLAELIAKFGRKKLQGLLDGTHYINHKNPAKGHIQSFLSEMDVGETYHVEGLTTNQRGRLYGSAKTLGMSLKVRSAEPLPGIYITRIK